MKTITVAGIDPSFTHTGFARGRYNLDSGSWELDYVNIVDTEKATGKVVRQNSDDLRRTQDIAKFLYSELEGVDVIFSEIPTGAQSARAALSFGIVIGLLGGVISSPGFRPLFFQVLPQEVKLAIPGGSKVTSKEEIVHWAVEKNPEAGWERGRGKTKYDVAGMKLTANNEHMADAAAVINAGVLTNEFRSARVAFERAFSSRQEL